MIFALDYNCGDFNSNTEEENNVEGGQESEGESLCKYFSYLKFIIEFTSKKLVNIFYFHTISPLKF